MEESSQAQSTNLPHGQGNQGAQLLQVDEEVNHSCLNYEGRQRDRQALRTEDVEKLVNDQLRNLKIGGNFEDALRREVDQANSMPFTAEIEQSAPPKRFSTPSFTHFKGDSDPETHLKHFKSVMILHKADDALMCKIFVITLRGAAQDWFHTLPSRFKAEKANIVGCDDRIASSAFKKGLPAEHDLYRELTITPSQTLAEVYATAERCALWDDDRIAAKKSTKRRRPVD
ncbi:unnamed protein product [Prunus brigantina]